MARRNESLMPGGDRNDGESFKWECIRRSNPNCPLRPDPMSGDRLEPTESEINEYRQRQYVDNIKFTLVTVALLGVLCGAALVFLFDNGDAYDPEPIRYQSYNSYFGGLINVVKVDGSAPDETSSTEVHLKMQVPEILQTLAEYLAAGYDGTSLLVNAVRKLWGGGSGCDCPKQPM